VLGTKMMVEIQGPTGRYRLGEVVHSNKPAIEMEGDETEKAEGGDEAKVEELPVLKGREIVDLEVESEMKELGLHVLICSVAWETVEGRRTFQRFHRFNVSPAIHLLPSKILMED